MIGLFLPLKTEDITFKNRVFVSPMCQYSSESSMPEDGISSTWGVGPWGRGSGFHGSHSGFPRRTDFSARPRNLVRLPHSGFPESHLFY